MERKFFASLYEGDSPNGVKLGMGITGGDFWPRVSGCSMLYRGESMETVEFADILAVGEMEAVQISPPAYIPHNSKTTYYYLVRRANSCGYEEYNLSCAVKVSIDSNGGLAQAQPNDIFDIKAEQIAGSKVQLIWYYCPIEQESGPLCFKVYYDAGTGQIDFENAIATIHYAGLMFYRYQTDSLEAGTYLFCVRAEDSVGSDDFSLARVGVQLITVNPDPAGILSVEAI